MNFVTLAKLLPVFYPLDFSPSATFMGLQFLAFPFYKNSQSLNWLKMFEKVTLITVSRPAIHALLSGYQNNYDVPG